MEQIVYSIINFLNSCYVCGRTFHSGYLNIPVNAYIAPRKNGTSAGATFGFNIQKKDRNHRKGDMYIKPGAAK